MTRRTAAEAIDAVWRIESARLIAGLARVVGDIGVAEDLAQDALVAALEQWPESGVPDNPGAWLMATAKHRAMFGGRHEPGPRIVRHAGLGPLLERGDQRVLRQILRDADVADDACQTRDESGGFDPPDCIDGFSSRSTGHPSSGAVPLPDPAARVRCALPGISGSTRSRPASKRHRRSRSRR